MGRGDTRKREAKVSRNRAVERATVKPRLAGLLPLGRGDEHPVQDRLDLERLHLRPQREDAGRDAGQVRGRPTGRRLPGERAEIAAAVGLELDRVAELVSELQRVVEQALIRSE